ncbi:MAG: hypothetical protein HYV16_07155 [Gammaproteobacteria bacterium]|nr:hypothetical protein [Gammaproteobacteria bacterium]
MKTQRHLKNLAVTLSLAALPALTAGANPFGYTDLAQGYALAASEPDKTKEGQCGEGMKTKDGKCGATKTTLSGNPKQGSEVKKDMEGKCGSKEMREGKCGGQKAEEPKAQDEPK